MAWRSGKRKFFVLAFMAVVAICAQSSARAQSRAALNNNTADIDSIPLIKPDRFDPNSSSSSGRYVKNKVSSSLVWVGQYTKDIRNSVKTLFSALRTEEGGLLKYYPTANELDRLIDSSMDEAERTILRNGLNDKTARELNDFLGSRLLVALANRILEKEGISNPIRRARWADRLKEEFLECSAKAQNYFFDADGCLSAVQAGFVQNIGLATTYETVRGKLAPIIQDSFQRQNFLQQRTIAYSVCVTTENKNSEMGLGGKRATDKLSNKVTNCALKSILDGIQVVTREKLEQQIKANLGTSEIGEVRSVVWPKFSDCLAQINSNKAEQLESQIIGCIDGLVINAAVEMVKRKVYVTPAVVSAYRSENKRREVANQSANTFKACLIEMKQQNQRVDGLIDTSHCEDKIKNQLTFAIVSGQFQASAISNLGEKDPKLEVITNSGNAILRTCWSDELNASKREKCLRESIVKFTGVIADRKLEKEIPAKLHSKNPKLRSGLVKGLTDCLQSNLPANISTATDLDIKIDSCTAPLVKKTALIIADHTLRESLSGKLPATDLERVVEQLVKNEFSSCLGSTPDGAKLTSCVSELKKTASLQAGKIIFPLELANYFKNKGGLQEFKIDQDALREYAGKINSAHEKCLLSEFAEKKLSDDAAIDKCFKNSIKTFVEIVAQLEFNKALSEMYKKNPEKLAEHESYFRQTIFSCIDQKQDPKFSLDIYLKNVYSCTDRITTLLTQRIAPEQLRLSLNEYLADKPGFNNASLRETIEREVLDQLQSCLSKNSSMNADQTAACTMEMQREATSKIVLASGRMQVAEQLNTKNPIPSVVAVEKKFTDCIGLVKQGKTFSAGLDQCIKNYSIGVAETVADAKLQLAIGSALGTKELEINRSVFQGIKDDYKNCLSKLQKFPVGEEFFSGLTECSETLQSKATDIVVAKVRDWLQQGNSGKDTKELSALFAAALPCLDRLMPSSPYSEEAVTKLDPQGSLRAIAGLIGNYISYDLDKAKKDLPEILAKLIEDLNSVSPLEARKRLVEYLRTSGAFDQLLKAMVKENVKEALAALDPKDQPAKALQDRLLKSDTFDNVFREPEGQRILQYVADKILAPVLVDLTPLDHPSLLKEQEKVKRDIADALVSSKHFGDLLISGGVQQKINELGAFTRFFARLLYGRQSTNWEHARKSKAGQAAEEFIREHILRPKFLGETISPEKEQEILNKAEALVKAAVTGG